MVIINTWCFVLFTKPSFNFRHLRVFVFCHRPYLKTPKPWKILISSAFEVLRLFIWFEHSSRDFVHSEHNLQRETFLLISGISGLSFFNIEDIRKSGNHVKFSEAHFFKVLTLLIWFAALFYAFYAFRTHFLKCCSKLSLTIHYYCLRKPKWYLAKKFVAFKQFSNKGNC